MEKRLDTGVYNTLADYSWPGNVRELENLKGCEAHSSVILSSVDENVFRKLGVNITYEPKYQTKKLYHN